MPNEFADHRASLKEQSHDVLKNIVEDIEVRILSSTDNLMDVGEDEPYLFEEKSLSEIRDSLTTSLNTSIDIDEIENESVVDECDKIPNGKRGTPDGGDKEDDEKEDKTEKDSGDSEGTDDTVREKVGSAPGTDSDEVKDEDDDVKDDSDLTSGTDTKEQETTVSDQTTTVDTPQVSRHLIPYSSEY